MRYSVGNGHVLPVLNIWRECGHGGVVCTLKRQAVKPISGHSRYAVNTTQRQAAIRHSLRCGITYVNVSSGHRKTGHIARLSKDSRNVTTCRTFTS